MARPAAQMAPVPGLMFRRAPSRYPLMHRSLVMAFWLAPVMGLLFQSYLAGMAVVVLFLIAGTLWRRDEPPMLVYCLLFQWFNVMVGRLYQQVTGVLPGGGYEDLDLATFLSLIGLLAVALGVRTVPEILGSRWHRVYSAADETTSAYNVRRLFGAVVIVYGISWVAEVGTLGISFQFAGFLSHLLGFRAALLVLLFMTILQQKRGYMYGVAAALFVILPSSISMFAGWSAVFTLFLVVLLGEWKPWSRIPLERTRNRRILVLISSLVVALFVFGTIWQGGVKMAWRAELRAGAVTAAPTEKMEILGGIVADTITDMDWGQGLESFFERMTGTFYFSRVLDHVPSVVPHEGGALTWRAVTHIFTPRFLFPEKPELGSTSLLVRKYTGLYVAGEESETSIGLSYMAEMYIDYGPYFMFLPLFAWGLLVGLTCMALYRLAPSRAIGGAAVVALLGQPFASFEGEFAYLLGGLIQAALIYSVLLYFAGSWFHRWMQASAQKR